MAESLALTDFKNLNQLRTKLHQDRRKATSQARKVFGIDTETDENGNITLLADSDGNWLDDITAENLIKFLHSKRYQNSWNFFYNITFDAEVILKTLGETLNNYKKTRKLVFKLNKYRIEYIPNKKLAVRKGHHSAVFFDIAQYYHSSLVVAYQKNIGELQSDYLKMKKQREHFTNSFYKKYPNKVRKYCTKDCIHTMELAKHWIKLFYDAFGFYTQRWLSSGYLAEKVLINHGINIPKFTELPYRVQDIAWRSYYGGRFEILKRGFIGTSFLYDINSAYPFALSKIPHVTKGKWIKSKSIKQSALLGFFKIQCDVPDCKYVPPFAFKTNEKLIFPSGKFQTYCTLAELKTCDKKYFKILEGIQYFDDNPSYPYKEFVESIYKKRLALKQKLDPLELPLKVILNSIYGKSAQRIGNRIGNLFCPVIASTITGTARAMLYQFVQEHDIEQDVVSFSTDSIISTKRIDVNSSELGSFALENSAIDVYVLQNGIYRFNGTWKKRGIGNIGNKKIEHLDTIEKNGKLYQVFKVLRVNRLRTSILSDRISEIGKFNVIERLVDLNADKKRLWFEKLTDVNDGTMIDSMPISLNYIEKNAI